MPAELDTGIGSPISSRALTEFTTDTAHWPISTQVVGPSVGDTATGTTVAQRFDCWDEPSRQVVVSITGASFTTTVGGPA